MYLKNIEYQEHQNTPFYWAIKNLSFGPVNLIVGKNASGKSRLLSVIASLASSVSGRAPMFSSGSWEAKFERYRGEALEQQAFNVSYKDNKVFEERFWIKNSLVLERKETGEGFVLKRKSTERVRYKVQPNQLMSVVRNDPFQHPQLESLQKWGRSACLYRFGSDFGKGNLTVGSQPALDPSTMLEFSVMPDDVSSVFLRSIERFGDRFKLAILSDMEALGYLCDDVTLVPMNEVHINGNAPMAIAIKERNVQCYVRQSELSQGMYRALALLIQFNASVLWTQAFMVGRTPKLGDSPLLIVDDIGEGLDHERSRALIELLIEKCLAHNIQLIMSSNDRYVMNFVPLQYWTVLQRTGSIVKAINHENSKEIFDEFSYSGLSNFDFFSGEHYSRDNSQ